MRIPAACAEAFSNTPIDTLRDGNIKATIWKNLGEKGNFFTVTFSRSSKDSGDHYQDTDSFSGTQLLRLAHLATRAYDRVSDLRAADREELQRSAGN